MRHRLLAGLGFFWVAVACTSSKPQPDAQASAREVEGADRCGSRILTEEGIGAVRIGSSVDSLRAGCTITRDTTITDMEGMPSRRLTVALGDDSVEAEIVNDKVWRLSITSPRLQTVDSLGVGAPISRFKPMTGARTMMGEGAVYLSTPSHCGMSFQLTGFKPAGLVALANLPPSVTVLRVLIFGCQRAAQRPD